MNIMSRIIRNTSLPSSVYHIRDVKNHTFQLGLSCCRDAVAKCKINASNTYYGRRTAGIGMLQFVLEKFRYSLGYINDTVAVLSIINARQCGVYASTHGRRMKHLANLYAKICTEQASQKSKVIRHALKMLDNVKHLKSSRFSAVLLSTAIVHCQSFTKDIISDLEIERVRDDGLSLLDEIRRDMPVPNGNGSSVSNGGGNNNGPSVADTNGSPQAVSNSNGESVAERDKHWQMVLNKEHIKIWRKKPDFPSTLYEYRVFGTYSDIPASAFWYVQLDLDYRSQWDKYVIKLHIVDRDANSGTELVQWITHFPYPMDDREYLYIRRHVVDVTRNAMILVSRAVRSQSGWQEGEDRVTQRQDQVTQRQDQVTQRQDQVKQGKEKQSYVKVERYHSTMVIRPHSDVNQNGFDYILIYYDDPKMSVPVSAYNKMAKTGVVMFIQEVHKAAHKLFHDVRASESPHGFSGNQGGHHYYTSRTW